MLQIMSETIRNDDITFVPRGVLGNFLVTLATFLEIYEKSVSVIFTDTSNDK